MQKDVTDFELKKNYDNSFAQQKGVKFPNFGSQNYFTLKYYFININKIITKGEAEEYVSKCLNKRISDLQAVRHLASGTEYSGYSILQGGSFHNGIKLKRGQYVFTGFDKVNEQWSLQTRLAGIPNNWEECKQNFNYCCFYLTTPFSTILYYNTYKAHDLVLDCLLLYFNGYFYNIIRVSL